MKFIFLLTAISFVNLALAAPKKVGPCQFREYQQINRALKKYEIRAGAHLVNKLTQVMMQEMGPRCTVFATVEGNALTGQAFAYEIAATPTEVYDIMIVEGALREADSISIQQVR